MKRVWFWSFFLFGAAAWFLSGGPFWIWFGVADVLDNDLSGWWMIGIPTAVFLGYLIGVLVYIPRAYGSWKWELMPDHVRIEQGVWWRSVKRIPYVRIQDVAIKWGPLRDRYNVYTVEIQTASQESALSTEGTLPGVHDPEPLADAIMAHVDRGD